MSTFIGKSDSAVETESGGRHSVTLSNRGSGEIEGVKKVVGATSALITLVTNKGDMSIGGKELSIVKYDADSGKLSFMGQIDCLKYEGGKKPLLKRIFK